MPCARSSRLAVSTSRPPSCSFGNGASRLAFRRTYRSGKPRSTLWHARVSSPPEAMSGATSCSPRSALLVETPLEQRSHDGPIVVGDAVVGGVAPLAPAHEHVAPENSLEAGGDGLERGPRSLVARVRLELDADAAEALE